jgi:hypothetical protein
MEFGSLRASPRQRGEGVFVALLLLGASAVPALAQASVSLDVEPNEAYANEPFTVSIRVENFRRCEDPQFPDIPQATVRAVEGGGGESMRSTITINGRTSISRSRTFSFQVTPEQAGELVIPPVKLVVDGRTVQTEAVHVTVHPSDAQDLLWAEITCDRQRIYVGQRVRLVMTIYVKPLQAQGYRANSQDMMGFLMAINFGHFPTNNIQRDTRRVDRPEGGTQTYFTYQSVITDYVPDRPGLLNFDDIQVGMRYPVRLSRDIFGRLEATAYRTLIATPKPSDVSVLALPTKGRPSNFTGAVGTFDLTVLAEPTAVRVGDPIKLTIEIRGDGALETLPPPDLGTDPKLTDGFRVPREELAGEVVGGRKRFTQVIRAERADITEIPRIEYPYFDPDREMYVVALSEPIPLKVLPAAELNTAALVERSDPPSPNGQALHALDGLHGNETRESRLLATTRPVSLNALALATIAPPAAYLIAWACLAYARAGGSVRHRRQRVLRQARTRLNQASKLAPREAAAEIVAALTGYLAERLDQPPARFIGPAAVGFLAERNASARVREQWLNLVERCEQISFGGLGTDTPASLAAGAEQCLRALERERL